MKEYKSEQKFYASQNIYYNNERTTTIELAM